MASEKIKTQFNSIEMKHILQHLCTYVQVVTVHSAAYTPLLLCWELLLGELENQRLSSHFISTARGVEILTCSNDGRVDLS